MDELTNIITKEFFTRETLKSLLPDSELESASITELRFENRVCKFRVYFRWSDVNVDDTVLVSINVCKWFKKRLKLDPTKEAYNVYTVT